SRQVRRDARLEGGGIDERVPHRLTDHRHIVAPRWRELMGDHGTGPGEITPDGCAVDLYAIIPPAGEAAIVDAAVPPGASVLELGCGTGRILRPLAEAGHPVLGVDESAGMLAALADLPTVRSR